MANKPLKVINFESDYTFQKSVDYEYRPLALQLKRELEKEYDCKIPSEKMLAEQAVNAHIRFLYYSSVMESNIYRGLYNNWSFENSRLLRLLSKEVDRAHWQYISAIDNLRSMKQPPLNINIKTRNAFLSENQQFNNNMEINESK